MEKHRENALVQLVYFPVQLFRKRALEQDLEFYNGPGWRDRLFPISPAQQAYLDSIESCCGVGATSTDSDLALKKDQPRPELLVAHAYVRYLGDLSGGQIMAKRLQKFNGLPVESDQGVAFYKFPNIEDHDQFKGLFRQRLNEMEMDEETRRAIIQEACEVFEKNIDLFQEFDRDIEDKSPLTAKQPQSTTHHDPLHHHHHRHHQGQLDLNVRPPPQCVMHMAWEREFNEKSRLVKSDLASPQEDNTLKLHPALATVAAGTKLITDLVSWMASLQVIRNLAVAAGLKSNI